MHFLKRPFPNYVLSSTGCTLKTLRKTFKVSSTYGSILEKRQQFYVLNCNVIETLDGEVFTEMTNEFSF
jgi:hypothetical protein